MPIKFPITITPQGDGNQVVQRRSNRYEQISDNHYPARGRKRPVINTTLLPMNKFPITITPQGDGNANSLAIIRKGMKHFR